MSSIRSLNEEGYNRLNAAGILDASIDARLLLEHVFDIDRQYILMHGADEADEAMAEKYLKLIDRRSEHIPLQHITGSQEFMGFDFWVNEHVLIPRQDTECLVEEAMIETEDGMDVLDMCTGSGCIIISLSKYKNGLNATAVDISEDALEVARANADKLDVAVDFYQGDLYKAIEGTGRTYDIIVSNPPYIASDVIETLMEEVRYHEPRLALDGDKDGLSFYKRIVEGSTTYLKPGGCLLFEIGYDQGGAVSAIMEDNGFIDVCVIKDLAGLDRVVKGRKRCLTS